MAKKIKKKQMTATAHPIPLSDPSSVAPSPWTVRAWWMLRALILAGGIGLVAAGLWAQGLLTVIALAALISWHLVARQQSSRLSIKVELLLFATTLVLGLIGAGRHSLVPAMPLADALLLAAYPILVGMIGVAVMLLLMDATRLRGSSEALAMVAAWLTLSITAKWELLEYASDRWLYPQIVPHQFQPAATGNSLDETMVNLALGIVGGLGTASIIYWQRQQASKQHQPETAG